ncbi:MAG TPA: sensor histidine kinase [Vicinamibacterales bacterium]|nr:sensor histidine kinase [Vicinamibacterales bacterium]
MLNARVDGIRWDDEERMRLRTWLVAALGLGSLVVLIVVSMLASARTAQDIYAQLDQLNNHHRRVEENLRRLRSDVNLSGIFVRDYLLDVARERAPEYREQIAEFRRTNMATLAELKTLIEHGDQIDSLQTKLDEYWATFEPLFDWTIAEKIIRSAAFLRREVVPRREAALTIAREIEELNNDNLAAQRQEVARRQSAVRDELRRMLWQTVLLGLGVSVVVVWRLRVLERRSDHAEHQMRELSQQLVNAQEEERKNLSRELHDHVAQVLTGLRMELGRIERLSPSVASVVSECKSLVDEMFQTVRSLALGLRPSMLDDLGLQAALEWLVRDFMSRYAINVDLAMAGDFDRLSENHRTCVYRVVQEALTNCVRHADAHHISVAVKTTERELHLSVSDDGVGLNPAHRGRGLGLIGIDERVKELHGTVTIATDGPRGTTVDVRLPLPVSVSEAPLARAAG